MHVPPSMCQVFHFLKDLCTQTMYSDLVSFTWKEASLNHKEDTKGIREKVESSFLEFSNKWCLLLIYLHSDNFPPSWCTVHSRMLCICCRGGWGVAEKLAMWCCCVCMHKHMLGQVRKAHQLNRQKKWQPRGVFRWTGKMGKTPLGNPLASQNYFFATVMCQEPSLLPLGAPQDSKVLQAVLNFSPDWAEYSKEWLLSPSPYTICGGWGGVGVTK